MRLPCPTMQATAEGGTTFARDGRKVTVLPGPSAGGDVVVTDLWKDLRAYLNASTWVNVVGFVLAAVAAFWSSVSSGSKPRRA